MTLSPEKPLNIPPEQISSLYRFSSKMDQVNWDARYKPNLDYLSGLITHLHKFLDQTIRQVTYNPSALKAVVGISGGLDSSVSAMLVAGAMTTAQQNKTAEEASLSLVALKGMSEEDFEMAKRFTDYIAVAYPNIPISFVAKDLSDYMKYADGFVEDLVKDSARSKVYSGELTSRLIGPVLMEYADRIGHCCIDSTNGTEYILGEIVLGAGAECAPIVDLYKSQVFDLAELVGVPDFIIDRPPINSTWGHDKIATYFAEAPDELTPRHAYQVLDPVLFYLFEKKYRPSTLAKRLGHSLEFVSNVDRRIKGQDHRRDIPYFGINDRTRRYPRFISSRPNIEMKEFMENSLAVCS